MNGVGDVLHSRWQTQPDTRQSASIPNRPAPEEDSQVVECPMGDSSASDLISPVPQYAARIGRAISLVQTTIHQLEKINGELSDLSTHKNEGVSQEADPSEADLPEGDLAGVRHLLEQLLPQLEQCRSGVDAEFRIHIAEELISSEEMNAFQHILRFQHELDSSDTAVADIDNTQATIRACIAHTRNWLESLTVMANNLLLREEQDLATDMSFIDKVDAQQLQRELCSWLKEVQTQVVDAHDSVLPTRAAVLLQDS